MTLIIVSGAFFICWFPVTSYFLFIDASSATYTTSVTVGYNVTIFLSHLYLTMNPFVYALKHEPVKEILGRLMARFKPRVGLTSTGSAT